MAVEKEEQMAGLMVAHSVESMVGTMAWKLAVRKDGLLVDHLAGC